MWSFLETGTNKEMYLIWHYFILCHNKHTDFFHLISNSWYNSLCFPWENKRLQEVDLPVITQLRGERGVETKPLEASIPVMASHLPRVQFNQQIFPDSPEVSITGNKLHYMIDTLGRAGRQTAPPEGSLHTWEDHLNYEPQLWKTVPSTPEEAWERKGSWEPLVQSTHLK